MVLPLLSCPCDGWLGFCLKLSDPGRELGVFDSQSSDHSLQTGIVRLRGGVR